jgi:hypothetical protein
MNSVELEGGRVEEKGKVRCVVTEKKRERRFEAISDLVEFSKRQTFWLH